MNDAGYESVIILQFLVGYNMCSGPKGGRF